MSGAEALAVVGIIANIIALVQLTEDIVSRVKDFSGGAEDTPKVFRDLSLILPLVANTLSRTKTRVDNGEVDEATCKAILPVVDGCRIKVTELKDILARFAPVEGTSKLAVVWKAVSSTFVERKVQRIAVAIRDYIQVLTLHHAEAGGLTKQERTVLLSQIRGADEPSVGDVQKDNIHQPVIDNEEEVLEISTKSLVSLQTPTPLNSPETTKPKTKWTTAEIVDIITELAIVLPLPSTQTFPPLVDTKLHSKTLNHLRSWWKPATSDLLWIQEPAPSLNGQSYATSTAVVGLAQNAHISTAFYSFLSSGFGTAGPAAAALPDTTALQRMIAVLILQIAQALPEEFDSFADFGPGRLGMLDSATEGIEAGIAVLDDLLQVRTGLLVVVIDRLDLLDRSPDQRVQEGLRALLKLLRESRNGIGAGQTFIKTLLVTAGQTGFLIAEVKLSNRCEDLRPNVRKEGLLSSMFAVEVLSFGRRQVPEA